MKNNEVRRSYRNQIFTIPNILSFVRLAMIPVIIWSYCVKRSVGGTALLLALSGLTDMADGFIARRLHMISDLGKMLDPVADKLTQAAVLFCLITTHPNMIIPFVLLCVKEICMGTMSLLAIRRSGKVVGAQWHGKITTVLLYAMMILHILWPHIPVAATNGMITVCVGMMLLSFALYTKRNIRMLRDTQ